MAGNGVLSLVMISYLLSQSGNDGDGVRCGVSQASPRYKVEPFQFKIVLVCHDRMIVCARKEMQKDLSFANLVGAIQVHFSEGEDTFREKEKKRNTKICHLRPSLRDPMCIL